jgi:hypothetical protein
MKFLTRILGSRIKGAALENLLVQLGRHPSELYNPMDEVWTVKVHGICTLEPDPEGRGIIVDLDVYRYRDKPVPGQESQALALFQQELLEDMWKGPRLIELRHYTGTIPYNPTAISTKTTMKRAFH